MTFRFGDKVTIPKAPEKGVCVVINVYEQRHETTLMLLSPKGGTFFTRSTNCVKQEEE